MSKPKKPKVEPFVPDILKDAILARMDDQEGMLALPTLYKCLIPQYEGLTLKRQAAKLSIICEGAHWKVNLDCPTEKISCRIAAATLSECLKELDARIARREVTWTPLYDRNRKSLPTVDTLIQ